MPRQMLGPCDGSMLSFNRAVVQAAAQLCARVFTGKAALARPKQGAGSALLTGLDTPDQHQRFGRRGLFGAAIDPVVGAARDKPVADQGPAQQYVVTEQVPVFQDRVDLRI